MRLALEQRGRVDLHRIALDHAELPRIRFAQLCQGRDASPVALDRRHPRARREQRTRQAAGAGPHFEHLGIAQITWHSRNPLEQLPVEQEILPERLARVQSVPRDHLAQRGQRRR